jgi:broad specificity phosphatase PhoE
MRLIITRHGETIENLNGILQGQMQGTLSKNGIIQAQRLSQRLKDEKIDYIFSSDLKRAIDTTKEIIKYHKDSKLSYVKELREKHLGEFEGKRKDEVGWDAKSLTASKLPEDGESMESFLQRVRGFLDKIISEYNRDTVLFVCHGGVSKTLISHILGKDISQIERIENTSVSLFEIDENMGHSIISFNCVEHLSE